MPSILFLTAYPIEDASCRYRIHQFLPYLESAGYQCTVSTFVSERLWRALKSRGQVGVKLLETLSCGSRRLKEFAKLAKFDFVVIHREAFPFFQPAVENWILRHHPTVIFSFDDAVYAGHRDVSKLNHPLLYRWKHGRGYEAIIRGSAHVIAGNRILADYARRFNSQVSVIPTVVDCIKYPFKTPTARGEALTIGWLGSHSTAPYLSHIEPALRHLAAAHGDRVQFRFFGQPDYRLDVPQFRSLPFDLDHELDALHSLDIGLMPLPDTKWTRGKCAFKAIQYMAVGVPTVASPVGITPELIQHDVNGILASSVDEWFSALDRLIRDANLRQRLALAARQTVEANYSLDKWGPRLVSLFDQLGRQERILQIETSAA